MPPSDSLVYVPVRGPIDRGPHPN